MKLDTSEQDNLGGVTLTRFASSKVAASTFALMVALGSVTPAWATIDNTVTATGSSPGNTDDVTATDTENVDVEDAAPELVVTKFSSDANLGVGDTATYTYTVENTGNVTLTAVSLSDAHDGAGAGVTPTLIASPLTDNGTTGDSVDAGGDQIFDTLAPGDIVTWTASYTVVQGDLNNNGGGDGDIDNTVTASATPVAGTLGGTLTADESVTLEAQNPSLAVTKDATAVNGTAGPVANVEVDDVITYTYVVTNDGNVPLTNVSINDVVDAGTGATTAPIITASDTPTDDDALDNIFDSLAVGDSVTFTTTYTVTQDDVDNLQ